ncbi:prepilin peptidase [Novosphingobium sp. NBM11]|uniref:prepilin peptidase n=1 Tax=Novosphingobium sp. NBM11 TaxID=2596914 RepID=UPI00281665AA|nr:prepilin peptidase [Novosphingobium sp. NBM11]
MAYASLPLIWSASAMLGAIVGSFLGAALARLPEERSVVTGRSACDHCGRTLGPLELVPVLSWLVQRGRCRTCGGAIGGWQLSCELGGATVALVSVIAMPDRTALAAMVLGWQLLLLALLDLRHFWLPLPLVGTLAGSGGALALLRGAVERDSGPVLWAGAGALAGFGMLWLIAAYYRRVRGREGMGGGDPLLLGAIGLWLGPVGTVATLLGGSVIGLLATVALLAGGRKVSRQTALPLGTCLAAAGWPVFLFQGFG